MRRILRNLSHVQIIALGYSIIILFGTALLTLPVATASGESAGFLNALFTATSSACVTGLVVAESGVYWSLFGQIVILLLIQTGGLGFMTIATFFFSLFRRKMGLRQKEVMIESINTSSIGGILHLSKKILLMTLLFEACGAVILFLRYFFHYSYPVGKSFFFGLFHSVSAFCNAGFDLNGGSFASFSSFSDDPVILLTLSSLILIGGLGFLVWKDLKDSRFSFRKMHLHTKIVLVTNLLLILLPAVLFFILERSGAHREMSGGVQILNSFFDAVTPRTAGFNTTDTAALSPASGVLTLILMFIGGSPGSTAGGIKTTTLFVLIVYTVSSIRNERAASAFGRRISPDVLKKAVQVFVWTLFLALTGSFLLLAVQPELGFFNGIFEVFSAIGTVGMSTGITRDLGTFSRILVILLMFIGRIGGISFGAALLEKKAPPAVTFPYENITIG